MLVAAHPDDESLGFGGVLARYAADGVETSLVTATRGQAGRYFGHPAGSPEHPGRDTLAQIRERELHAAAAALGIGDVSVLDYEDQQLDRAPVAEAVGLIAQQIRRVRPHVILTFPPDGAYGHPDHVAISQLAVAATVAAAPAHQVSKLYYLAWGERTWAAYEAAFKKLVATVDGVERQATPWPEWALTTIVDTHDRWPIVRRAVSCHESQTSYAALKTFSPDQYEALWGSQSFYRVFSLVACGRRETDLFEGISQ